MKDGRWVDRRQGSRSFLSLPRVVQKSHKLARGPLQAPGHSRDAATVLQGSV